LGDKLGERLGERRYRIVALMKRDPSISIPVLAKRLGISTTAVEKNIKFLKQTGFVARSGPAKGGRWVVSD
jgi:biotin operon repressor